MIDVYAMKKAELVVQPIKRVIKHWDNLTQMCVEIVDFTGDVVGRSVHGYDNTPENFNKLMYDNINWII